jgi:hypothetical protein
MSIFVVRCPSLGRAAPLAKVVLAFLGAAARISGTVAEKELNANNAIQGRGYE